MRKVAYHYNTAFRLKKEAEYTDWIIRVCDIEGIPLDRLAYTFCGDEELLNMNRQFLDHDYYTDILTFPHGSDDSVTGEIFISVDRVQENAKRFSVNAETELRRVIIHGVLHLCGHEDATEQERKRMRELENRYIEMFHVKQ